jgi:hypothetical protein
MKKNSLAITLLIATFCLTSKAWCMINPAQIEEYKGTIEYGCFDESGNFDALYTEDFFWVTPTDDDGIPQDYQIQMEYNEESGNWWIPDPDEDPFSA